MASVGEEDVDYESDPEEAKRSLAMRRRAAASDDEEGEGEVREKPGEDPRAGIHSDESDDQGGAAEYDDDEEELGLEEEEEIDEEEEGEDEVLEQEDLEGDQERGREGETGGRIEVLAVKESDGDGRRSVEESIDENAETQAAEEEEKKENEPFAVPTAGAFYMHDDRFRDNAVGRHRRTHGGRKLWESKDERKWGHDKFEEITLHERRNEEGKKPSKGPHGGRGRNRGVDRGFTRGNRSKEFDNNNQRQVPKGVRGRGPRRYEPAFRNNRQTPPTQNKQSGKPVEKNMQTNSERTFTSTSNAESDLVPARKNVFASSLNYFSPPFYPSGSSSSNKDITLTQKRDVQAGSGKRNVRSSAVQDSFHVPQTNPLLRGKNIAESVGVDKLYIDDSVNPAGKTLTNLQMPSSGSSFANTTQAPQPGFKEGVLTRTDELSTGRVSKSNDKSFSVNNASPCTSAQQLGQRPGSGSGTSSPPKTTMSPNSFESGEVESPSDSSKSKGALIAKGKGSVQGSGRGTLTYGGAQVMGSAHGDQNFPATPAFLPVMQFGGQHPGGMGVPAVGMAFPGYVAQPQLGLGNTEMTWLPVLAGAAGALGATYCPPYISVDGSYHARPSGQTSSVGSLSKENNANKTNNEWKPSQKPEIVGDEYGQRQNKPRRYSQMNVASEPMLWSTLGRCVQRYLSYE
ncbi:protein CASC3 [Prunus yedoensis var. nudiflora]|uniref:Protein CASC3 n=1 Tax=Prunus yedoensis var. nudiflora TaxID=2094558 RepID=A0A314XY41_PRUYE|nr:protein CASC3 [Prunus yedoensis var. nudiflora]